MKNLLLIIFVSVSVLSFSQEKKTPSINWMSMQEALEASATPDNKKKIFIDAYTDWCGWCKKMDKSTFLDSSVIAYMNENYYAVKFDAETQDTISYRGVDFTNSSPGAKKKGGRGTYHYFASALLDGQLSYPSYVILDEKHTRMAIYKGFMDIPSLVTVLKFFTLNQHQQYTQYLYGEFEKMQKGKAQNSGK